MLQAVALKKENIFNPDVVQEKKAKPQPLPEALVPCFTSAG